MASDSKSGVSSWPRWQIALALGIGTPVVIGLAYWYLKKYKRNKPKNSRPKIEQLNLQVKRPKSGQFGTQDTCDPRLNGVPPEGKPEEAKSSYERAKDYKNKGNKLFKEGKYDKAIECYTDAISLCPPEKSPDISTFYQNRAAAYENLKNYTEVIKDCTEAIKHNKTYVKALQRRAKAFEHINELESCLEDITAVCILEGFQNQNTLHMTDRVLKKLSKTKAKEAFKNRRPCLPSKHFIRHYFISFSEDPVIKAVEEYKETQKTKNPADLSGYKLAIHLLSEENFDDIIDVCSTEIDYSGPNMTEALLLRGTFSLLQGQTEEALEDLQQLLSLESVDVKVRVNALIKLGTLKVQLEKIDDALNDFNRAVELDVNNADIYLHRGQVALLMDKVDDTLRDMEKSAALNPNFPSARAQKCYVQYRCGIQYNDLSQRDEALKGFEETKEKFPTCSESYFLYAQVLCECQEFDKAEEFFRKAGELDPTDPNVYVHRGVLALQHKQDMNLALKLLNQAIEMDEKCQFAYETLGSIEVQRGNLKRGLELFNKAIHLAHTEAELAHLLSLHQAAQAQAKVAENLGLHIGEPGS